MTGPRRIVTSAIIGAGDGQLRGWYTQPGAGSTAVDVISELEALGDRPL